MKAKKWACWHAKPMPNVLICLGLVDEGQSVPMINRAEFAKAEDISSNVPVRMGGAGSLELIYSIVYLLNASRVVETGVAYGWSSMAILLAQRDVKVDGAQLVSVDMPYPMKNNDDYVGVVVPEYLRDHWTLFRTTDKKGLPYALSVIGNEIDVCHYDSDKSWSGRKFAFPLLWDALRPGGVFISDDIQDNLFFKEFSERVGVKPFVIDEGGKYVGIMRKR